MKRISRRIAIFGFLGCLIMMAIAYRNNSRLTGRQEENGGYSKANKEVKESIEELDAADNAYELTWRGKIFNFLLD